MSEIVIASPFDLPGVLDTVASKLGGQPYRDRAISAFVLSREIRPHQPNCDSYVKFGADHKILRQPADMKGKSYHVERGDRRDVKRFGPDVMTAFEEMDYDLPTTQGLWEEDVTSVTIALEEGDETLLFIASINKRYGIDEEMLLDVPVISGAPVFIEPEDMEPAADLLPSFEQGNLLVMEYMQLGMPLVRQTFGELHDIFVDFAEQTRAEQLTADIEVMLNAMMPE